MSSSGGQSQRAGPGKGNDRGKGPGENRGRGGRGRGGSDRGADSGGGRGRGSGSSHNPPYRPAQGDSSRGGFRGRGGRGGGRGGGHFDQGPPIFTPPGGVQSPSSKVTQTEDALAAGLMKRKSIGYPERPGYGTQGREIQLFANYFELKSVGKSLYRYSIDIDAGSTRMPAPKKAKQIICLLLEEHFPQFRPSIVTDYRSTIISHLNILDQQQDLATFDITYQGPHEDEPPKKIEKYRVTLKFTGQIDPTALLNYLTSSNTAQMFEEKADTLQALNIAIGHYPKSSTSTASHGANKHYATQDGVAEKFNLGAGLEALRGYFVSVRAATARILVNVQVKYIACYEYGPLSHIIRQFQLGGKRDPYSLKKFLYQLRVHVTHIKRKTKTGRVIPRMKTIINVATPHDGRSLPNPPIVRLFGAGPKDVQFFLDAPGKPNQQASSKSKKGKKPAGPEPLGSYITIADFFQHNYNIKVDPNMPVVNVGTIAQPSYLPVEVCEVEAGQPANAKLSPNQTREMLKFAVRTPSQNASSIVKKGLETLGLGHQVNATLAKFGIQTNSSLITVPGRVLPPPSVHYKDLKSSKDKRIDTIDGSWNMKSIKFSTTSNLSNWTWIYITPENRSHFTGQEELETCLDKFTAKLNEVGVIANRPKTGTRVILRRETYEKNINEAIGNLINKHKPKLILTILPFNDTEIYNCVKQACDIRHGVRNVNVLAERFKGCNQQYFANVGLKFNLKLGGINQVVKPNQLGIVGEGKTMLLGIDVTHPSPGSAKGAPSVAAMVASVDSSLGQWPAEIRIQNEARNEMVEALDSMLKAHLRRWANSHKGAYPENIIVYRDGVSEGQYDLVTSKELPLLKSACKAVYPASTTAKKLPRFSIIIVGKRHHTRFYPTRQEDADRSNNPSHGTVVDRGVTEARNWDFFLQAHTALKGTARPAHYYTVWDEIFLGLKPALPAQNTADILEAMTHHMCYLFGRATKAVSICPPAYYADLVCTRARCYLSRAFEPATPSGSVIGSEEPGVMVESSDVLIHPNVKDTMFYI